MDTYRQRLEQLRDAQQGIAREYQQLLSEYEANDIVRENEQLRAGYTEYRQQAEELAARMHALKEENRKLRQALSEQMLDERMDFIRASRQKLDTYFSSASHSHMNKLIAVEQSGRSKIEHLYKQAGSFLAADQEEMSAKLAQLQAELNGKMAAQRQALMNEQRKLQDDITSSYDQMASEPLSEEVFQRRVKQNRLEMKIGLNLLSKLGILMLLLAVGAAFRYTYLHWFNEGMKSAGFFLLGLLMMAGGEWLFRKKRQVFALSLLGGGISVLYGSVFYSYFLLEIFSLAAGMAVSVLITAAAVALSLRYQSRTICSFGLVGGYLPFYSYMFAYGMEGSAVYVAMGYLFLLSALILAVSLRKRWTIVHYISFGLHVISMLMLVYQAELPAIGMLYAVASFALYLGVTLYLPMKQQVRLSGLDFALLAVNTAVNCIVLYSLLYSAGWEKLDGLLSLIFSAVYLALGILSQRRLPQERGTRILFYGTSVAFSLWIIPLQFGIHYVSVAWLLEALVLAVLGHLYQSRRVERIGWIITALCVFSFIAVDILFGLVDISPLDFEWKYTFLSLGLLGLALFYAFRLRLPDVEGRYGRVERDSISAISNTALVNIWFYTLYESGVMYERLMPYSSSLYDFFRLLLFACVTLVLAYALSSASVLRNAFMTYYSRSLYGIGYLMTIVVTLTLPALNPAGVPNGAENIAGLLILIALQAMVLLSARDLLSEIFLSHNGRREWYPVLLGLYLLGIITAFLGVQLRLGSIGWLFSMTYLLLALGYIGYGFRRKYLQIRRIGLGLTLFSTGKMLLFDLNLMTAGSKILAFFAFGILLLGISYLYQRVSSSLETAEKSEQEEVSG
ncbi:hypothetical protein J41TS12_02670 [Paenibacillus antibioticophila]|uniref:DUF2339 domain-containing protein n=1 Tax=Paenibacillus antibioticophila TaxID=1274374 RepID=A0A919XLW7_9BACL|nr:DUF2339 domain-containing protein [Paenibacillus antibioticophila]GIO35406.1 hypothetical protein J41TS12_02670 [Paenibacillus antibioticophila]